MFKSTTILILASTVIVLSSGNALAASGSTAADSVTVNDPYVRLMPPGQPNTAAFMTLVNSSKKAHQVVKAESSVSEIVELHTHVQEGQMMKMRAVEKFDVPAQGRAELKPGGHHVMLINLKKPLKEGQKVSITLVFEDQSRKAIEAPVRPVHPSHSMQDHGKH